jgi:hypothetical protein
MQDQETLMTTGLEAHIVSDYPSLSQVPNAEQGLNRQGPVETGHRLLERKSLNLIIHMEGTAVHSVVVST